MIWLLMLVVVVVAILLIVLLNRFYRKASREVALIRTGAGGQRIITDGGFLALPFLHKVSEVNMKTTRLEIERAAERSVITADRLRVDVTVEFYVRVEPSEQGIATAAQALGSKTFRGADLAETLEGKLVDAVLAVAAKYPMDELQNARSAYVREVSDMLHDNLASNGLLLESVSLTRLDQTPFHALEENNAFNAVGMRRLAEIVAISKKERAVIEADAEVAVRKSQLDAIKQRLLLDQQEEEATIQQQLNVAKQRANSDASTSEEQASAERRKEFARIEREREVKALEIIKDRELRQQDIEAAESSQLRKLESEITIAAKQADVSGAVASAEQARVAEVQAKELIETARETAVADREKQLALIRALEQAEVDDTRVRSEAETLTVMAKADASATEFRADAEKTSMLAKAEGTAAVINAENSWSEELIRMKVDMQKLETLPRVVDSMMKPAEKIDSIRINHITGFGGTPGTSGSEGQDKPVVNQVTDGVLSMALQLPAVKRLGEEIGINIGEGVQSLTDSTDTTSAGNGDTNARSDASRTDGEGDNK